MCRIEDTGRLGQFASNFEFLKTISIFLFFVSIFHNRKEKQTKWLHEAALLKKKTTLKS